jgi:hypothetical protein
MGFHPSGTRAGGDGRRSPSDTFRGGRKRQHGAVSRQRGDVLVVVEKVGGFVGSLDLDEAAIADAEVVADLRLVVRRGVLVIGIGRADDRVGDEVT